MSFKSCKPRCPLRLRLSGLTHNLAFELLRGKGCKVEVDVECGGQVKTIKGKIYNAGTDFVDIRKEDNTVVTVLHANIRCIKWPDPCCNPCTKHFDCNPCFDPCFDDFFDNCDHHCSPCFDHHFKMMVSQSRLCGEHFFGSLRALSITS